MTDRALIISLQQENSKLTATLESLTKIIESQSQELSTLKALLLERDAAAEKLKRFVNLNLPKKTDKRKSTRSTTEIKPTAPTPKERGNNGAKRKSYDNLEEILEHVFPVDANFSDNVHS